MRLLSQLIALVVVFSCLMVHQPSLARPADDTVEDIDILDNEIPWPWAQELLEFPWSAISGQWVAQFADSRSYFSFSPEVNSEDRNSGKLYVMQFDRVTGEVMAKGEGLFAEDRIVASMANVCGGSYMMMIRFFGGPDVDGRYKTGAIASFGYSGEKDGWEVHLQLDRFTQEPLPKSSPISRCVRP